MAMVFLRKIRKLLNIKGINDLASYSLSWSDINEKEWNDYISESGMSNYLQSW